MVAREAAGYVRVSVEALLSMGLPNSPMAGARLRVTSGNFVTARPVGIREGADFGFAAIGAVGVHPGNQPVQGK